MIALVCLILSVFALVRLCRCPPTVNAAPIAPDNIPPPVRRVSFTITPPTAPPRASVRRPKLVNPFRSRALSPPTSPQFSPTKPSPPGRRSLAHKFKSLFKSTSPDASLDTPVDKSRRRSVARTQPYGPPWNAPMPVPDSTFSPRKPAHSLSPSPKTTRKPLLLRRSSTSPTQLSPRSTFMNQLDEKLSLLQQRARNQIPLPRK